MGGRREAFLPALRTVTAHIEANWAQRTAGSAAQQAHGEDAGGAAAVMYGGKQRHRPPDFYWVCSVHRVPLYVAALLPFRARPAHTPPHSPIPDVLASSNHLSPPTVCPLLPIPNALPPPPHVQGEDMVAWNEVAMSRRKLQVLSGYPGGPTNLPMYGGLAPNHWDTEKNASGAGGRRALCAWSERCRHTWLREASSMYWFGHKASNSQRYWVMDPACRLPRTVLKQGRLVRAKSAWRLPIRNCTVPFCASAL